MKKTITIIFLLLLALATSGISVDAPSLLDHIAPVISGNSCLLSVETADNMTQDEIKDHIDFCSTVLAN